MFVEVDRVAEEGEHQRGDARVQRVVALVRGVGGEQAQEHAQEQRGERGRGRGGAPARGNRGME